MTCNYEFETIYISTQKPYFGENYNATSTKQEIIEVDQNMVRNMISAAFLGSVAMSEYLDQIQTILQSVEKVSVTTNLDLEEERKRF